ncbi:MAG: DUF1015 domain-containing protein [Candidatus Tectomicrobia bacterium]|uniref:DUF1015 domain-containing protein n=1 Tax=Tectimicrobiota bacterium TaxID=2528274 RepID=A0A933LQ13_UNCTE|nr:DUF1015 domain-containing protein [Candidatus Tectomicrobia bacterium]
MPHILPFRGTFYNKEKLSNLFSVLAPPYDVISPEEQDDLYATDEYNIIRIILGKDYPEDNHAENRYTRAAKYLQTWKREDILIKDSSPSIYVYEQQFNLKLGGMRIRRGFFCLTQLEEFEQGSILPHEHTFSEPIADRYRLLQACLSNFNPVFALYPDEENHLDRYLERARENYPLVDFWDGQGMRHTIWPLRDPAMIKELAESLEKKRVFIADGHHRYETALKFRNQSRESGRYAKGANFFDYTMFYYTNIYSPGLAILPVHRLIKSISQPSFAKFEELLREFFFIEPLTFNYADHSELGGMIGQNLAERQAHSFHSFIVYTGAKRFLLLTLKSDGALNRDEFLAVEPELRKLDLVILHRLIIQRLLPGSHQAANGEMVFYTPSEELAIAKVDSAEFQLAFFVNSVPVKVLMTLAESGLRLPHKSTFFYPKLLSGLVINQME